MKLILTQDVSSLGGIGEIVNVKSGYGRNYLLPRGYAILADERNTNELNHHKRMLANRRDRALRHYQNLAKKMSALTLELSKRVGEEERIFGSVTTAEIALLLSKEGFEVSRKSIKLPDEVKKLGVYTAQVNLHAEVNAELKFWVVAEESASS